MKFVFIIFKYFPYGGLERDFLQIAQQAILRGHEVTVITQSWQGNQPDKLNVIIKKPKGLSNHRRCRYFSTQVQNYLAQQRFDLIVGFNRIPGLDIFYAADECYAAKVEQKYPAWYRRLSPRCRTLLGFEKAIFQSPSKTEILSIAETAMQKYIQHYQTSRQRIHILPPNIKLTDKLMAIDKSSLREKLATEMQCDAKNTWLLMVGSHFKTKGVDRSLRALATLPSELLAKINLIVVGKGDVKPYQRLAKSLAITKQIRFLGARDDVPVLMQASDILVHPARHEFAGKVIVEALAYGLPVIVTDHCGYAMHVANANAGVLVPSPFQQKQFNQLLSEMLGSDKRKQWQENARTYCQRMQVSNMPERALNIMENLVKQNQVHERFDSVS